VILQLKGPKALRQLRSFLGLVRLTRQEMWMMNVMHSGKSFIIIFVASPNVSSLL
jgi:hypothetical protein